MPIIIPAITHQVQREKERDNVKQN
jgi:hypothetical protein